MTLELGEVIARIGGGGPVPSRYVYDLGGQPIPTSGSITQAIDANPGEVVAATLEWTGSPSGDPAVSLSNGAGAISVGVSFPLDGVEGPIPVSVIWVQREGVSPMIEIMANEGGYTATRLTVIVIPQIEDTPVLPDAPVLTIENIRSETVERVAAARAVYDAAAGTGKNILEFAEAALATAPIRAFVGYSSMSNVGGMGATTGKVPQIAAAHQSIKTPAFAQFESNLAAFRQDVIDGKVII